MSPFGCFALGCHQTAAIAAKGEEARTTCLDLFVDCARNLHAAHPDVVDYAVNRLRSRPDLYDALPADVKAMGVANG